MGNRGQIGTNQLSTHVFCLCMYVEQSKYNYFILEVIFGYFDANLYLIMDAVTKSVSRSHQDIAKRSFKCNMTFINCHLFYLVLNVVQDFLSW